MARKRKDISGKIFGKVTVLEFSHREKSNTYYKCVCQCDKNTQNFCLISNKSFNRGTKSCGCTSPHFKKGKDNINWLGCGDLSLNLFHKYRLSAYSRNLEFEITIEYAWDLFIKQNKSCALTGLPLIFNITFKNQSDRTVSLDRIDSSKGYIEGNVQWVHKLVNYFKKNMPNDMFIEMCNLISNKNNIDVDKSYFLDRIKNYKYLWNNKK